MNLKIVLRLFLITAAIVAASADNMEDADMDMDMDDMGDMDDEDFQDTDPDMMDPGMMDPDMMDPDMDDGAVMDDMDSSDDAAEEEPQVKRVRPVYQPPVAQGDTHFTDAFVSEEDFSQRWILSKAKKDNVDEAVSKYDGRWSVEEPHNNPLQNDLGLVLKSQAKHHAVAAMLDRPFTFTGKPFVVQYEVKFQNGQECGGAYIKLLSHEDKLDLTNFQDKTPYTIMFGPDKCGNEHKLHFIFRHKHPLKGTFEEKHASKPTATLDSYFTDKKTHLYTLVVNPNNKFEVYVDQSLIHSGSLLEDMTPAVNPPKEITDPEDKKPADWDERERITDPDAVKPDDWDETEPETIEDMSAEKPEGWLDDEPELVADETAEKPSDWDDDTDGEWEPAMINNPKCKEAPGCGEWKRPTMKNPEYKGKWVRPMIDNPNYKGKWTARKIPNPNYYEDLEPYKMTPIAAVGLELWSMSNGILFDNFIVTDSKRVADQWAADSWRLKQSEESAASGGFVQSVIDATHERPWLWAVLIVVIVLPLVLIVVYCCMSTSKEDDEAAQRKKTDEPTPDVDVDDQEESSATEQDVEPSTADQPEPNIQQANRSSPRKRRTKADLDVKEDDANTAVVSEDASADPGAEGDAQ